MSLIYAPLAVHAQLRAVGLLLNGGSLDIYDDRADGPLATLTFANPAFKAPVDGEMPAYALDPSAPAARAGEARTFRCLTSAGAEVLSGDVGPDLVLEDTAIYRGTRVMIDGFSITED